MKYSREVENLFSNGKWSFWLGHSIFWIGVIVETGIVFPESVGSFKAFWLLVIIGLEGFLITLCLRVLYKKYFFHRYKLLALVVLAFIYSFIAGAVWAFVTIIVSSNFTGESIKIPLNHLIQMVSLNYTTVLLWSCLYLGYKIWEELKDQKYQLEHERALLRTSQLEMLKYQLNPHFLFNTLSSLRGLITADPVKAKAMVTHISEFLRYSLLEGKNNEVQFIKEIEIIKQYLNIEQVRYNEDLLVEFDVSPETNDFMIPIFLIHPLVENAVKHGMQTSKLPLNIFIHSKIENHTLIIEVKNSGNWIDKDQKNGAINSGIGLQNIKKRLENSFPGKFTFDIIKEPEFVKITITIFYEKQ
jgi:sensor histidine kinase YesM